MISNVLNFLFSGPKFLAIGKLLAKKNRTPIDDKDHCNRHHIKRRVDQELKNKVPKLALQLQIRKVLEANAVNRAQSISHCHD